MQVCFFMPKNNYNTKQASMGGCTNQPPAKKGERMWAFARLKL